MRLRERDKREVRIWRPCGMDDDVYKWAPHPQTIRAAVYPGGSSLNPKIYGDAVTRMKLMLYDADVQLEEGMGVSLDENLPALRIKSVERWDHTRAVLEEIPEGRRA